MSRTYHVCDIVEPGNPQALRRGDTGDPKDCRTVDGNTRNPNPLLKNLQPDDQLNTASGVEFPRFPAEEHSKITILLRRLTLELNNVANILEFGLGETIVFATQTTEYISSFFFAADFDEPTGRLGHKIDDAEEEYERYDLECDGEAPDE